MEKRPTIVDYTQPSKFLEDMVAYRRASEPAFSVLQASKNLKKCSPALVTLICKGKRSLTSDRVDDISRLLKLSVSEKQYLRDWIDRLEAKNDGNLVAAIDVPRNKLVSTQLLNDWVNVYVKDAFGLEEIRKAPDLIYGLLGGIASQARIEKSIKFLLANGYLKKDLDGKIVLDTPLAISDDGLPNYKIKQFHKAALKIAKDGIDKYTVQERLANALVIPLDDDGYEELAEITKEYSEKLKSFSEKWHSSSKKKLYQVILNISPTGGKV